MCFSPKVPTITLILIYWHNSVFYTILNTENLLMKNHERAIVFEPI